MRKDAETIINTAGVAADRGDVFELVDEVPHGYFIWNIGKNMIDGYLPLCQLCPSQQFEGGQEVNINTLKAIKCEGAQTILAAIGGGAMTVKEMEGYIKKYENAKPGTWVWTEVKRMKEALPIMRTIKGL